MALATYGDLKTSVASWMARADLTSIIPDFITQTHKVLMRDLRGHPRLRVRASITIDAEYEALPLDFLEVVSLQIPGQDGPRALTLITDDEAANYGGGSGRPRYFSIVGDVSSAGQFRFTPVPGGSYSAVLDYYATLTAFSLDADTNWILTTFPNAYLYGSLYHGNVYLQNAAAAQQYRALFDEELALIKKAGTRMNWGGNGMQIRPA
jgi:hypothetical protein